MSRSLSEMHDHVARFYEEIAVHLLSSNHIFPDGIELNEDEKATVQGKVRRLTAMHRQTAEQYRAIEKPRAYTIRIPGRMYHALRVLGDLETQNTADQAALAALNGAKPQPYGRGHVYDVTGEEEVIDHLLEYLQGLWRLVRDGDMPAYECGASIRTLYRVWNQGAEPVDDRRCST